MNTVYCSASAATDASADSSPTQHVDSVATEEMRGQVRREYRTIINVDSSEGFGEKVRALPELYASVTSIMTAIKATGNHTEAFEIFTLPNREELNSLGLTAEDFPLHLTPIEEIRILWEHVKSLCTSTRQRPVEPCQITVVEGVPAGKLCNSPHARGSVIQAAAQFDAANSTTAMRREALCQILEDSTQGPAVEASNMLRALHQHISLSVIPMDQGQPWLCEILKTIEPSSSTLSEGGYLDLEKLSPSQKEDFLRALQDTNCQQLQIFAQDYEAFVYVTNAAPSFQGYEGMTVDNGSVTSQLCAEIVASQYAALAQLAVIKAFLENKEVNVHFTLIGMGAFRNPAENIGLYMLKVKEILDDAARCGIRITPFVHVYNRESLEMLQNNTNRELLNPTIMTKEQFLQEPSQQAPAEDEV